MKLPTVTQLKTTRSQKTKKGDILERPLSPSTMVKFGENPYMFKLNHLAGQYFDTSDNASFVLGKAFHTAMEVYYGGSDTVIISSEADAVKYGLEAGMQYLAAYNDGFINYTTTLPTKEVLQSKLAFLFNSYIQEMPYSNEEMVMCEVKLQHRVAVRWRGEDLRLQVPLVGRMDKVVRRDGVLKIVDYKTASSFSDLEKIDGHKILQAVAYYLLVYAETGEEPYSMVYEEVKHTKNRDGGPQVRTYELVFKEQDMFFDFFFRYYEDIVQAMLGHAVFVPNVKAMFDNEVALVAYLHRLDDDEEVAKQMKQHRVDNLTDLLRKKVQKASSMKTLMATVEKQFTNAKNIDYNTMETHEKIRVKLMEHGLLLNYDSHIEGSTVDLYRYAPSIGLKMSKLAQYTADVEQVLGATGVRVLAPIPGTTLVGFEVPRAERTFVQLPAKTDGFNLHLGVDVNDQGQTIDLRTTPHTLVAGATRSGKSVFMNGLIEQTLRLPKKDVELVLLDPKRVEFGQYKTNSKVREYASDIMHIHSALGSLVSEMENRYRKLEKLGVQNVDGQGMPYIFVFFDEYGDTILQKYEHQEVHRSDEVYQSGPRKGEYKTTTETIYISKEIERMVLQLAQKARAAGIHMVLATQRPSVDIVTGSIKANFPTKICFRTAREIDSKVMLDEAGAEKLLGMGDMLVSDERGMRRLQAYSL